MEVQFFMKRTLKVTLSYFFFILAAILGIICAVFNLSMLFRIITALLVVIPTIAILNLSKCPYCGKYGMPINPFQKSGPTCKKCGKQP